MHVVASAPARELIGSQGGKLFVWVRKARCCGGLRTLATSGRAKDGIGFRRVDEERRFELFLPEQLSPLPDELHLDAHRRSRSVSAYWNGCAWIP